MNVKSKQSNSIFPTINNQQSTSNLATFETQLISDFLRVFPIFLVNVSEKHAAGVPPLPPPQRALPSRIPLLHPGSFCGPTFHDLNKHSCLFVTTKTDALIEDLYSIYILYIYYIIYYILYIIYYILYIIYYILYIIYYILYIIYYILYIIYYIL